jgi:hypothetical protein
MAERLGQKVKRFGRLGIKAGVVVGTVLGAKHTKDEYQKQKDAEFSRARGELAGDLQSLKTEAGLKKMGGGTEVVGHDASGNIYGGAGVQAGRGVEANPNIVRSAQATLPVGRLSQQQLAPFNAKREGVRVAAGVIGGQIGLREAARDVAAAKFEAEGGRRGQDPIEEFRRKREATATSTVVAGATGNERFTAKESAAILGRRAARAVPNPLKFVR